MNKRNFLSNNVAAGAFCHEYEIDVLAAARTKYPIIKIRL